MLWGLSRVQRPNREKTRILFKREAKSMPSNNKGKPNIPLDKPQCKFILFQSTAQKFPLSRAYKKSLGFWG